MLVVRSIRISRHYALELVRVDGDAKTGWRSVAAELAGLAVDTFFEVLKWLGIAILAAFILAQFVGKADAATTIPKRAEQYRPALIRAAHATWGLDAPVAVFAAQIHTESRWNPEAKSHVGALGLAQFMPATAKWIPDIDPALAPPAPRNPGWSIRAMLRYDLWLFQRARGSNEYERMAFALSGYNGGEGWVNRDKRLAAQKGLDSGRWFGHVETVNAGRSAPNWRENRAYPRQILTEHQFAYERDGWGKSLPNPEAQ